MAYFKFKIIYSISRDVDAIYLPKSLMRVLFLKVFGLMDRKNFRKLEEKKIVGLVV